MVTSEGHLKVGKMPVSDADQCERTVERCYVVCSVVWHKCTNISFHVCNCRVKNQMMMTPLL